MATTISVVKGDVIGRSLHPEHGVNQRYWRPRAVTVDGNGNIYVADTDNNPCVKETLSGRWITLRA